MHKPAHLWSLAALRRRGRMRLHAALFALVAYVLTGAIVPSGHMATGIDTGTAFHLCPGDLRSAQLLAAFTEGDDGNSAAAEQPAGHHHGHSGTGQEPEGAVSAESGSPAPVSVSKSSADPGCGSGGIGAELSISGLPELESLLVPSEHFTISRAWAPRQVAWLRPPVRSPPV